MSELVETPEDRFSRIAAQLSETKSAYKLSLPVVW